MFQLKWMTFCWVSEHDIAQFETLTVCGVMQFCMAQHFSGDLADQSK